ncbi:hypothetical protein H696_02180 [Fonticula alba]|uniref:Uncharacterized protein n=1 Tax=Fonticula alba TaxID=691883 RepID=A0A058ZAC0_FONAL|nr:hypothetical protein H696_02180 [Fonticula alba]KCV71230.1 hypothetical protein H696_02180 [Fonticula alba]|eukprot:XP_009494353.1 hypothetical protein H696_02180 [Fonticula alba]
MHTAVEMGLAQAGDQPGMGLVLEHLAALLQDNDRLRQELATMSASHRDELAALLREFNALQGAFDQRLAERLAEEVSQYVDESRQVVFNMARERASENLSRIAGSIRARLNRTDLALAEVTSRQQQLEALSGHLVAEVRSLGAIRDVGLYAKRARQALLDGDTATLHRSLVKLRGVVSAAAARKPGHWIAADAALNAIPEAELLRTDIPSRVALTEEFHDMAVQANRAALAGPFAGVFVHAFSWLASFVLPIGSSSPYSHTPVVARADGGADACLSTVPEGVRQKLLRAQAALAAGDFSAAVRLVRSLAHASFPNQGPAEEPAENAEPAIDPVTGLPESTGNYPPGWSSRIAADWLRRAELFASVEVALRAIEADAQIEYLLATAVVVPPAEALVQ